MKTILHWITATAFIAASASLPAAELGMPAPPLRIGEWVKGKPVDLAKVKPGSIQVVEFWATWCAPCKESIPHLTELQKRLAGKGVVIIGITDEQKVEVSRFLKQMGAKMEYTVAIDKDQGTWNEYMKAFGEEGIPHSFVVKDGIIAWHGSPLEGLDDAIERMLAGTYDMEEEKLWPKFAGDLHDYLHMASDGDTPLTRAAGRKLLDDASKYPDMLNSLAWQILTHDHDIQFRDRALALEAARKANAATGSKDSHILDTYALALFENGKTTEAIQALKSAINQTDEPEFKDELRKRLLEYEKKAR